MPEPGHEELSGVAETLLLPLYVRALESQRPDALLRDERAVAFVRDHPEPFERVKRVRMDDSDRAAIILRTLEFDRLTREFLARHPRAVVLHIGCGFDERFARVDDGRVEWYDLDLPEVIALRRKIVGDEAGRYHHLACSVFDSAWLDAVSIHRGRDFLFLAEGVFMYFSGAEVRSLVLMLRDHFRGAELAFDAFSPFLVRANNLRMMISRSGIHARYCWGLARGKDVERWGPGIVLLHQWFPLDRPEPRLAQARWMRHIPPLAHVMGVYHYRLGEAG